MNYNQNNDFDNRELSDKIHPDGKMAAAGIGGSALAGAAIGTAVGGPVGSIVGAAAGGIAGSVVVLAKVLGDRE